jgi:hypothetical protein
MSDHATPVIRFRSHPTLLRARSAAARRSLRQTTAAIADGIERGRSGREPSDSRQTPACQSVQARRIRAHSEADTLTGWHRGAKQRRRGRR